MELVSWFPQAQVEKGGARPKCTMYNVRGDLCLAGIKTGIDDRSHWPDSLLRWVSQMYMCCGTSLDVTARLASWRIRVAQVAVVALLHISQILTTYATEYNYYVDLYAR